MGANLPHRKNSKQQSAMEYLITYGWAILAVAIAVTALFALGVFGSGQKNLAAPGTCAVVRISGPGTLPASLGGLCQDAWPQYVGSFDGVSAYANVPNTYGLLETPNTMTLTAWISPSAVQDSTPPVILSYGQYGVVVHFRPSREDPDPYWWLNISSSASGQSVAGFSFTFVNGSQTATYSSTTPIPTTKYTFIAVTINTTDVVLYQNGTAVATDPTAYPLPGWLYELYIGSAQQASAGTPIDFYNGTLSNIQMYNAALPGSDIMQLYQEGIGGSPIDTSQLVGWWQLNGNTNDSSGNGDYGTPGGNLQFITNWWTGGKYNGVV